MSKPPPGARALRWLFAIQLLSMGAMEMSGPFWPLHLRALGGLAGAALAHASAWAYAGPLAAAMCCTPLWGRLADRVGHKPMVLRALLALAATQAWIAWADSVASVLAARVVQGGLAGFIAAAQAYGASLRGREQRAQLIARLQVATAIGSVAGPVIGGWLLGSLGFRAINLAAAAVCALCAVAALWALPCGGRPRAAAPRDAGAVHGGPQPATPALWLGLLLGIAGVQVARTMPQAFFGLYAEQALAAPSWFTGLCYGLTAAGLALGAPWWGARFDRRGRPRVLAEASLVAWACVLLSLLQLPGVPVLLLLAARLGWGFALGALLPVFYALLSREATDAAQGRMLGWGNAASKAGALLGSALGGLALAALPLPWLMVPVAAAYALAALGLQWLRRRKAASPVASDVQRVAQRPQRRFLHRFAQRRMRVDRAGDVLQRRTHLDRL